MANTIRYELGFNWASMNENVFTQEIDRTARRRRIRWVCVPKAQADKFRKRVDQGRVKIDLFLNTQADGLNMDSPSMLLCRSLKAANCLVIEDPDDARIYADKGLQFNYLKRAGLPVPTHFVIESWKPHKRPLSAVQQSRLGPKWVAQTALGMGCHPPVISTSKSIAATLVKGGFKPEQRLLISRHHEPFILDGSELRFMVWYLFGHVVPCCYKSSVNMPEMLKTGDVSSPLFPRLVNLVKKIAGITQLDWFMSELVAVKANKNLELIILEPANALAGLGPGVKPLSRMPAELMRIAAERIVEVAWRRARRLPLSDGITINLMS